MYELSDQYFKYKTIVEYSFGRKTIVETLAITLCSKRQLNHYSITSEMKLDHFPIWKIFNYDSLSIEIQLNYYTNNATL